MKRLLFASLAVATLSAFGAAPTVAAPALPRVVLAVDGVAETRNLPVLVAERLGYFRDEGLIVTLVDAPADPSPGQLMKDGRADGAVAFYHHTFMSQADDHLTTQAVVLMGATPGLKLLGAARLRDTVKTPANLKGRPVYAGGANSGKTTTANWLMAHAGLGVADYTRLPNVSRDEMAEGLKSGKADAIVSHEPDADLYEASGVAYTMADLESVEGTKAALGTIYPSTSLYMPVDYVKAHPATVQHLVDACLRAMAYINTHSPAEIAAILPSKTGGKDRAAFLKLLGEDKQMFATDGLTPPEAARQEWRVITALTPKYGQIRFDDTFTNRFVETARAKLVAKR